MNFTSKLQKKLALPLLFLFMAALLFCALSAPAHAGDVAGVSTRLYLTVTGDLDCDATFYVSYTDALGPHTKVYYPGVEIAAWTPVTITVVDHTAEHWTLDADVQENWLQGVGGVTTHGDVFRVTGTNTVQVFATNFGLHYVNVHVALSELDDSSGDNGGTGGDNGSSGGNGNGGGIDSSDPGSGGGTDPSDPGSGSGGNGGNSGGTDPSNPGGGSGDNGGGTDPSNPGGGTSPDDPNGGSDSNDPNGGSQQDTPSSTPGGSDSSTGSTSPKTGDTRAIGVLAALALLCAIVFAVTYIKRKKGAN
ncbi:MAG: hypothetical protein MR778_00155 [Clostridiales bacterium]|nr:hypothetical protein [Clostridiales bacterium]MDD6936493.1 hypothetical protein [Clostridiales bacterium]MDY2962406.1 hypothetical protein [Oscillospiraceae bacterium]